MTDHFKAAVAFGAELIRTQDLDPVYLALTRARLTDKTLSRVMLAYFCLYHLGAASFIGTQPESSFWVLLEEAARNEARSWPRGAERRHWRGAAAVESAAYLRAQYEDNPSGVLFSWYNSATVPGRYPTFVAVAREVRRAVGFGPWIAFKVADMLERVLRLPIDFSDCALGVYREPRAGAALILTGSADTTITDAALNDLVRRFLAAPALRQLKAPPHGDRALNVQEVETIMCKYKSHVNGRYPVGKDLREVSHGLRYERYWGNHAVQMSRILEALL